MATRDFGRSTVSNPYYRRERDKVIGHVYGIFFSSISLVFETLYQYDHPSKDHVLIPLCQTIPVLPVSTRPLRPVAYGGFKGRRNNPVMVGSMLTDPPATLNIPGVHYA